MLEGRMEIVCRSLGDCAPVHYSSDMVYRFENFELDTAKGELRKDGKTWPIEPQVFALLTLLIENRERLVSKDEIIEKVWDRREVSDASLASRIKSARQALGDDGKNQRFIRTIHSQGFRFVAEAVAARSVAAGICAADTTGKLRTLAEPPSIAILPFRLVGTDSAYPAFADALPHELIADLSRLRWLFVTARGSSFRLRGTNIDPGEVGRLLGVRYCLSGTVEIAAAKLAVTAELVDTRTDEVIWAERFAGRLDDIHSVRETIRTEILAALEIRIPLHEARLARLSVTEDLDAWSAYHLGLQHVYRFNRRDNEIAGALFQQSVSQDPSFARAYAGLSFVHFQAAFMQYARDPESESALAQSCAVRGLELDPIDPFVNFTMGRSFWLKADLESSLTWLERATVFSPNYAQGLYARAWTEAIGGRYGESRQHVDLAMRLSPLDPLYYAMLGTRAWTHSVAGEEREAADWAERAARAPGAHVLIAMIAVACHSLAGQDSQAAAWAANVRLRNPQLTGADYFRAFPMRPQATRERVAAALARFGF
jgi:TolB-like protein